MPPITVDPHEISTSVTANEYDRWERVAYYSPKFDQQINQELDRLGAFEPNWDAEGAPPINTDIIQAARDFIASLPENIACIPAVVPSATGNLQFEWNAGSRSLELEIETPSRVHYLKWHPGGGIEEENVFDIRDIDQAVFLIRWFMRGVTDA